MPSSPCEPNEQKFGKWGFYYQPNNLGGGVNGLNLKKKFFKQPYWYGSLGNKRRRKSESKASKVLKNSWPFFVT